MHEEIRRGSLAELAGLVESGAVDGRGEFVIVLGESIADVIESDADGAYPAALAAVEQRIAEGKEPDNIDKEFLRLWFRDNCDPYDTSVPLPEAPRDLVLELARRYITLYEMITWKDFNLGGMQGEDAITTAIQACLYS
jgi:phosphoribosylaminoimidazole-succinocarboxamide synthase